MEVRTSSLGAAGRGIYLPCPVPQSKDMGVDVSRGRSVRERVSCLLEVRGQGGTWAQE